MTDRYRRSREWLARAERVIPTGSQTFSKSRIQLPADAAPLFLDWGRGGRVGDIDGNVYVDQVCNLMAVLLGHGDPDVDAAIRRQLDRGISLSLATDLETELAERMVAAIPCADMVRFGKNGSDATAAAIRLARAATGRDHVVAIGYHGWQDWYIGATSRDKGVPAAVRALTHKVAYNDLTAVRALLATHDVAAVILEPLTVPAPAPGYLEGLARETRAHGAVLIFDEVVTGFRVGLGGAQAELGITPDLACFGKGMANGMPLSAVVGRRDLMMEMEEIFFSGTFGGECLSLAAALATLDKLTRAPVHATLARTGQAIAEAAAGAIERHDLAQVITLGPDHVPSWRVPLFQDHPDAPAPAIRTRWLVDMLAHGVLTVGTHNICYAHDPDDIAAVAAAWDAAAARIARDLSDRALIDRLEVPVLQPVFRVRA